MGLKPLSTGRKRLFMEVVRKPRGRRGGTAGVVVLLEEAEGGGGEGKGGLDVLYGVVELWCYDFNMIV